MHKTYSSTLDKKMIRKTTSLGFLNTLIFIILILWIDEPLFTIIMGSFLLIYVAIIAWAFLLKPINYIITDKEVIINKRVKKIKIPVKKIISVGYFDESAKKGFTRNFAIDGLFGIHGNISTNKYRGINISVTRHNRWVLISTKEKYYIISPDGEDFVDNIVKKQAEVIKS